MDYLQTRYMRKINWVYSVVFGMILFNLTLNGSMFVKENLNFDSNKIITDFALPFSSGTTTTFYISPTGNDSWIGDELHPFASIEGAQTAIETLGVLTGDVIVYLREGRYVLTEPIEFNSSTGGTEQYGIYFRNYPGEIPIIDAGKEVSNWEEHEGSIWRCRPEVSDFRQFYITTEDGAYHNTNNPTSPETVPYAGKPVPLSVMSPEYGIESWERRAIRAREILNPENPIMDMTGDGHPITDTSSILGSPLDWKTPFGGIESSMAPTLETALHYFKDVEFVYHLMWNLPRIKVETVSEMRGTETFIMQQPAFNYARMKGGTNLGFGWPPIQQPNFMENAYQFLNEPGEWYFDRWTGWLFYWPLATESMNSSSTHFYVPNVETLVEISGNETELVQNVHFEGITFKHANWLRPNEYGLGHVDLQANYLLNSNELGKTNERSPGAIIVEYSENIGFENCTFTKFGGAGIDLYDGTADCQISGCIFDDLSGTAVNIGGVDPGLTEDDPRICQDHEITNNYFTNIAVEFKGGHAIWAGYVQNITIAHNEISGTAYTAISVGWGWSGTQTVCRDNKILYNHITNYMMEMKDGGAIYTLSLQNNTQVQYNHIHDGCGSGLYPDEQTWNTSWNFNVVYRSGNSLQDHSLGVERSSTSIRENNITQNYFAMMPIIEPDRQQTHIANNEWDITDSPSAEILAIVANSGLESAYALLLPVDHEVREKTKEGLYWSDFLLDTPTLVESQPYIAYGGMIGIVLIGIGMILKTKPTKNQISESHLETRKGGIIRMKTANINQLFEYYFILLIGFLFYENVVFNETIESGLEYTLTIMMILIIFILGRKLKPIPIHNLTLFLKSMLLICSLFFFSIGIQLPMEIQEFGLNHWIFSTAINILMIGVLIGIIPLLLLQLQVYSHTSELESKEQVGKLMEVSFRMPMTFLIIGVFGNWSLLAIPIDDASYIIPMGLSIIGLVMMFYIDKIPYRTGEKKQESKTQFQLDMLQYLQFLFRIVLVPVFIFSSLDHDIFQFEIIFFIGIGATVYEMMAKIFKQNKISRNTTDRILTLFCFLLLFSH